MASPATPLARRPFPVSGPMLGLLTLLLLFVLILTARGEIRSFASPGNICTIFHGNSYIGVAALGTLLIILSGGIDLSIGSVMALVTVVAMTVFRALAKDADSTLLASLASVGAGLLTGVACSVCNGLVVTRLKVTPFVASLGMLSVARGLAVWLAGRNRISFPVGQRPGWVDALSRTQSDALFFDPGVWSLFALAGVTFVLLVFTTFGRYTYAIGANEGTARLCGIPVERYKVLIYAVAGLFTGWAGLLLFAHTNGGDPNAAVGLELEVIAAVVIGGASLTGGVGTVQGTMLGVLILGVLDNGVSFSNVPVEVKYILIGAIVVINTALSGWQRSRGGA